VLSRDPSNRKAIGSNHLHHQRLSGLLESDGYKVLPFPGPRPGSPSQ
jgi:hypothetical protein